MSLPAPTAYGLLTARRDPSQPFVTHYAGPASRVELSVTTTANGVAKAAGLLRDGLGLEPGATVSVDLPWHWQLPVWVLAALSAGARCGRDLQGPVEVRVVGPDGIAAALSGAGPAADDLLVSACDAFGMPVRGPLPAGALDVALEARVHPDFFAEDPDAAASAALIADRGAEVAWTRLVGEAGAGMAGAGAPGPRRWLDESTPPADLMRACVAPVLDGGSLVIATGLGVDDTARLRLLERIGDGSAD